MLVGNFHNFIIDLKNWMNNIVLLPVHDPVQIISQMVILSMLGDEFYIQFECMSSIYPLHNVKVEILAKKWNQRKIWIELNLMMMQTILYHPICENWKKKKRI